MKIEVWSDYVCPFCYIGKRHLEKALEDFPHRDSVEIEFKSFELDPGAPVNTEYSIQELLSKKYGTSLEEAKSMTDRMSQQAATVGLDFQFDSSIPTNTFEAHRLTKYAKTIGKEAEMTEILLYAHFTLSKHIGDRETLVELAKQAGLGEEETVAVLEGSDFSEEVRRDEEEARQIGVQGVPFFVINRKYAISGAQPSDVFLNSIQKVWEEENKPSTLQPLGTDGLACDENGCEIPPSKS
ncbi:DsbA family oxidoreductase [Rossellomorea vietnamensis]|uniref:Disulfide bond formation protein DsbA n=1 Tax=Rossellomorea vietnamensis TaxID=218284 RepID=A0A0N8GH12_9BACI|nr:DsbA family oxidoreductase [Rossellomorea vietnamensis]KPL60010.1 disulfide bond formation protein DsbA [Rossellomorea vietnamensis]